MGLVEGRVIVTALVTGEVCVVAIAPNKRFQDLSNSLVRRVEFRS